MSLTPARRKANDKYLKANYSRIALNYPKEYVEKVKQAAQSKGESIAGYVKKAIDKRMQEEEQERER